MAQAPMTVNANELVAAHVDLVVRITGMRERAIRNWLGIRFIKLAAWVLGVHSLELVYKEADHAD